MDARLKLLERLKLQLSGYVQTGEKKEDGWKEPQPVYAFNCPVHGIVETTPMGYNGRLVCPMCEEQNRLNSPIENDTPKITE